MVTLFAAVGAVLGVTSQATFLPQNFNAGLSGEGGPVLNQTEQTLLNHTIEPGDLGALTYFWATGGAEVAEARIRVYVDGETEPSVAFTPAKFAGVMIGAQGTAGGGAAMAPWSNRWWGQLGRNAYHSNVRIPFQRSIVLTYQAGVGQKPSDLWIQARGVSGLGEGGGGGLTGIIPGLMLPPTARLQLQVREEVPYVALDYMLLAEVPAGRSGAVFATALSWDTESENTIEGCVRAFSPPDQPWPGMLISTGWEDYYASSWGMVAGPFTSDIAGTTLWSAPKNAPQVSVYRFHTLDPLLFNDGIKLVLRNGDTKRREGKCLDETGGTPVGKPGNTTLSVYSWVYVW